MSVHDFISMENEFCCSILLKSEDQEVSKQKANSCTFLSLYSFMTFTVLYLVFSQPLRIVLSVRPRLCCCCSFHLLKSIAGNVVGNICPCLRQLGEIMSNLYRRIDFLCFVSESDEYLNVFGGFDKVLTVHKSFKIWELNFFFLSLSFWIGFSLISYSSLANLPRVHIKKKTHKRIQ